ncbi:MAG TPA: hypothetical protein VGE59_03535 [Patescibacteria group bacterium]
MNLNAFPWARLASWAVVVAWLLLVVMPQPVKDWQADERQRAARHTPQAETAARAKATEIVNRALANPHYSADAYQHDIRERLDSLGIEHRAIQEKLRAHVEKCGGDALAVRHAYERWLVSPEGRAAYRKGGIYEPVYLRVNWEWWKVQYALFIIPMLLIFSIRAFALRKTFAEGLALMWVSRWSLLGNAIVWPLGYFGYEPHLTLEAQVQQAARELRQFQGLPVPRVILPSVNVPGNLESLRVLSRIQSVWVVLRYIWGPPGQSWHRLLMIWRRPVIRAVCVSIVASVVMLLSPSRASAAEVTEKEGGPTFLGLLWTSVYPTNPGAPPGQHVFWLFKEGDVVVYNVQDPSLSVLEFAPRPLKVRCGSMAGTIGPFVNLHLDSSTPTRFGLEAVLRNQLGRDTELKGPVYLYLTGEGHRAGFFTPNLRLLHQVEPGLKIGAATTLGYERGVGLNCLFGPAVEIKTGKKSSLLLRFGEWLAGPLKGTQQFRTDFVLGF